MVLNNSQWFLLGALCILFLYFITYYFTRTSEKYNLYFAVGCFIGIVRTLSYNSLYYIDKSSAHYTINVKLDHLSIMTENPTLPMIRQQMIHHQRIQQRIWMVAQLQIMTMINRQRIQKKGWCPGG